MKNYLQISFIKYITEELTSTLWYHGSNMAFENFTLHNNKLYREIDLPVWFFTQDIDYAKSYGRYLYEVKLNIHNTFNTRKKSHYHKFLQYLKDNVTPNEQEVILDEQMFQELPYWTCQEVYYCAVSQGFDSILIAEELTREVDSIGVFDPKNITIKRIIEL